MSARWTRSYVATQNLVKLVTVLMIKICTVWITQNRVFPVTSKELEIYGSKTATIKENYVILRYGEICFLLYCAAQIVQHEHRANLCLRTAISYSFVIWNMFHYNQYQILRNHTSFFYFFFSFSPPVIHVFLFAGKYRHDTGIYTNFEVCRPPSLRRVSLCVEARSKHP
jgi:hypothetical protein